MVSELLKLIESADPADTEKMDEIDKLVQRLLWDSTHRLNMDMKIEILPGQTHGTAITSVPKYSRSRDALKSIRIKGWKYHVELYNDNVRYQGGARQFDGKNWGDVVSTDNELATEELAELYVILMTIEYERNAAPDEE